MTNEKGYIRVSARTLYAKIVSALACFFIDVLEDDAADVGFGCFSDCSFALTLESIDAFGEGVCFNCSALVAAISSSESVG